MMQMAIPYLLDRAAVRHPGKTAVISEHGSWTFPQWRAESEAMALALKQLGVMPGDHVAVMFLNGRRLLAVFMALFRLGAVAVPLNVRLSTFLGPGIGDQPADQPRRRGPGGGSGLPGRRGGHRALKHLSGQYGGALEQVWPGSIPGGHPSPPRDQGHEFQAKFHGTCKTWACATYTSSNGRHV